MRLTQRTNLSLARERGTARRGGYVLYAVLIMVVVLALLAYRFTDAMTTEYRGATRTADMAKLRSAAVSGIVYAMASLADPNTFTQMGGSGPYTTSPSIFNNQTYYGDYPLYTDPNNNTNKNILFSVVSVVPSSPGYYIQQYGVIDEGGKININALAALDPTGATLYNVLLQLPNMAQNQQVASNIVAYVLPASAPPLGGGTSSSNNNSNNTGNTSGSSASAPTGTPTSYYQGLTNPYFAKNGPLNTLDELLLVEGVTPQLLYGNDQNMNGIADDYGSTGGSGGSTGAGGSIDRGWQDYLTVNGREFNITSSFFSGTTGVPNLRIDVNADSDGSGGSLSGISSALQSSTIDQNLQTYIMGAKFFPTQPAGTMTAEATMTRNPQGGMVIKITQEALPAGTMSELQTAITAKLQPTTGSPPSKGQAIGSLVQTLMNTQIVFQVGTGKEAKTVAVPSPLTTSTMSSLLPNLLDQATTSSQVDLVPRVNLSTASQQVISALLLGLPGFTQTDVQNVISAQSSLVAGAPATTSGAWLVTQANLTPAKYQILSKFATGTSMLYRIQAVGYYQGTETNASGGMNAPNWPMARVEALVDTNLGYARIVYMRDLTSLDNPRGFNLPLQTQQP